jgi:hypothetical protein
MAGMGVTKKQLMVAFLGGGGAVFGTTFFLGYLYSKPKVKDAELRRRRLTLEINPVKRKALFDEMAKTWYLDTYWAEFCSRLKWWKYWYISKYAYGEVLEVGAGAGTNQWYYSKKKVDRLTLLDYSRSMLDQASAKWVRRNDIGETKLKKFERCDAG